MQIRWECRHWLDTDLGSCLHTAKSQWKVGNQRRVEMVCVSSAGQGCAESRRSGENWCARAQQGEHTRCCYSCCSELYWFLWVFLQCHHLGPNRSLQLVHWLPADLPLLYLLRDLNCVLYGSVVLKWKEEFSPVSGFLVFFGFKFWSPLQKDAPGKELCLSLCSKRILDLELLLRMDFAYV